MRPNDAGSGDERAVTAALTWLAGSTQRSIAIGLGVSAARAHQLIWKGKRIMKRRLHGEEERYRRWRHENPRLWLEYHSAVKRMEEMR